MITADDIMKKTEKLYKRKKGGLKLSVNYDNT